jgi:hypothetical protein
VDAEPSVLIHYPDHLQGTKGSREPEAKLLEDLPVWRYEATLALLSLTRAPAVIKSQQLQPDSSAVLILFLGLGETESQVSHQQWILQVWHCLTIKVWLSGDK